MRWREEWRPPIMVLSRVRSTDVPWLRNARANSQEPVALRARTPPQDREVENPARMSPGCYRMSRMKANGSEDGSMASRIGDAIPDEVRRTLLAMSAESKPEVSAASLFERLPGMLRLDPESFTSTVARMNRSRVDQARTTLKNALELAIGEHGDSLTPEEVLEIVARADALLDVLIARREELDVIAHKEQMENARREQERERQRLARKADRDRARRTGPKRARKPPASDKEHRPRPIPTEPWTRISIAKLYARLDQLKFQARYMDTATKQKLRQEIRAALEHHQRQARSYVRPDDSLRLKAREVLAVLGDEQALASKARSPAPLEPAPLKPRSTIYPARGLTVSGGLPSLGRRY